MRTIALPLVAAVLIVSAAAQDVDKPVNTIRDVEVGMPREKVLAGLGNRYKLTEVKEIPKVRKGAEGWKVEEKDSEYRGDSEYAWIVFFKDKTEVINIYLHSGTGESARLAQQLYRLLYQRAEPIPVDDTEGGKLINKITGIRSARDIQVQMRLSERYYDGGESFSIAFSIGEEHFNIEILKPDNTPAQVALKQVIVDASAK